MGSSDLADSSSDTTLENERPPRKSALPASDFASVLFTGDLFNELSEPLPILTLDVEPVDDEEEVSSSSSEASPPLYGVSEPAYQRVRLEKGRVRADFIGPSGEGVALLGHVVDASLDGLRIELESVASAPSGDIDLIIAIAGGLETTFPAHIVRNEEKSLSLHYEASDPSLRFRLRFLSEAMNRSDAPPSVRIQHRKNTQLESSRIRTSKGLALLWTRVLEEFSDDARHQAFLTSCIELEQLSYALERYRVHKRDHPEADVDAYLKQIGTILGFYALKRSAPNEDEGSEARKKLFWLTVVILLVISALYLGVELASRQSDRNSNHSTGQF